jgi:hypothetical protein
VFRLFFLCLVAILPLFADDTVRTETETNTSPALKDLGLSQWLLYNHRPNAKSRFGYGFNFRYLNFLTTQRVELTASGTLYLGKGFVNLNPGRTTDGRWTTSIVGGYRFGGGWSLVALADPKWHHRVDLPTTVFKKLWVGKGPLYWRVDDFHVGNGHAYHYQGVEIRAHPMRYAELFVAPQISLLGPKKFVTEFGFRTSFSFPRR